MKTIRFRDLQSRAFGVDPLRCVLCGSPLWFNGITGNAGSDQYACVLRRTRIDL
jgi:hypothetical protein